MNTQITTKKTIFPFLRIKEKVWLLKLKYPYFLYLEKVTRSFFFFFSFFFCRKVLSLFFCGPCLPEIAEMIIPPEGEMSQKEKKEKKFSWTGFFFVSSHSF